MPPRAPPALPTLRTARLVLRPFVAGDAARVVELANDRRVGRWMLHLPYPYRPAVAEAWIASQREQWIEGKAATLAIANRRDRALIGAISLLIARQHDHGELGYWLGVPYWGHGLATEAGVALLRWGFDTLHLVRVFAQYLGDNRGSGRVLEKIGMLREGVRRRHLRKGNQWLDAHQFGILREEYEAIWPIKS
jgi:RimJ/RimL family protein N-acetyltransferase